MRIVIWLLRATIFVTLFGLAVKNSAPVDVRLYLDAAWQAPLSLVILASFAAGTLIGMTALVATLIKQRREIGRLRGQIHGKPGSRPSSQLSEQAQSQAKGAA
ncbi:MAG: LapA family protein [Betaproteobacteria bacterium]|nr:LapA family protein [Betaproteobacteria bacterium]